MLQKFKDLSNDRVKIMLIFVLSLVLSFGFGYLLFRYETVEAEKEPFEVINYDYVIETELP